MKPDSPWFKMVGESAYSSADTLRATYNITRLCLWCDIPGDLVECGVAAGAQVAAMAMALCEYGDESSWAHYSCGRHERRVHLYDSFCGVPEPAAEDVEFCAAGHHAGLTAVSLEQVQANMQLWGIPDELLVYHVGEFCQTMPMQIGAPEQIALLRMDADLHRSTAAIMRYLYPRVVPGGWVICDDWALSGSRQAVLEAFHGEHPSPVYWRK